MRRVHGRIVALGAALLVVGFIGVAAWAYWRAGGAGSGAGSTTAVTQPLTVSPGVPTAELYPGGRAAVAVTVTNPNAVPLRVGSLGLDPSQGTSGFAVDGDHSACGVLSLSFTKQTNGGAGWTIEGNESLSLSLTNALGMSVDALNACQGASFTVHLAAAAS